jgi:hypothetical protein
MTGQVRNTQMKKNRKKKDLCQTAEEIGKEYSQRLNDLAFSYENLTGYAVRADDESFWETPEVVRAETLAAFWWRMARMNDPEANI